VECGVLAAALVFCLAAGGAFARPDLVRRTAPRPVEVEMLDGSLHQGGLVGLAGNWARPQPVATTGERLPEAVQVNLAGGPVAIPTTEIRRILVRPVEQMVVRSDPTVRVLYLGHRPDKLPEPSGWYQPDAAVEGWEKAAATAPFYRWRYIPRACWIWAKRPGRSREDDTVLFRHEFSIPTTSTLVAAHLDVSADDQIESFFINGASVAMPTGSLVGKISHWDVTHLLQPGRNLLAARVTNAPSAEQLNYVGFCYRIVCDLVAETESAGSAAPAVRLQLANGDRLSGEIVAVSSHQWLLRCNNQVIEVDPDWVDLAWMNYRAPMAGNTRATARSGGMTILQPLRAILGNRQRGPTVTLDAQPAVAWNEELEPNAAGRGIQGRNGEWTEGRIEGLKTNRIQIKPRYGETSGVSLDRIAWLQPNRPDSETQFLFRPADFPAIVRVRLANGDQLTGALESLTAAAVTVTPHFSKPIRLELSSVLSMDFVMSATARCRERIARAWPAQAARYVAVIGEPDSSAAAGKDKTIQAIQRALVNLGLEMRWLDAYQMIEPGGLSPDRYPVLINLDQNERLFYTVRARGDGFEAIQRYVEQGGTLVHLARGVPFAQAYVADRGRWRTVRAPADLNAPLQMDIATVDRRTPKARPFQLPPNQGQHLRFVLNRASPYREGLPAEVELPMISDARFRPITDDRVTTPSTLFPIYRLVDDAGVDYGAAMAIIRYAGGPRPHYGVYVNHLLYRADVEGTPMIEYLLPRVIELTLGASRPTIANLADTQERRSAQARGETSETPAIPPVPKVLPSPVYP